jgi:hypothetical protein
LDSKVPHLDYIQITTGSFSSRMFCVVINIMSEILKQHLRSLARRNDWIFFFFGLRLFEVYEELKSEWYFFVMAVL